MKWISFSIHFLFLNHRPKVAGATWFCTDDRHSMRCRRTSFWGEHKTLLIPALSHTHSYYFTPRRIKISFTHAGRRTQRESDPRSSLSHRPTVPQPARVWERERKAAERERREARMRSALVCLREMMDEVERCDDLAHRSNSQWETTFDWHLSLIV